MKKLMTCTLVGLFCLNATGAIAQSKQETPQERILRLETENKVLQNQIQALTQQVQELAAQIKKETPKSTTNKSVPELKPYYANLDIQNKCDKFKKCHDRMGSLYQGQKYFGVSVQVTEATYESYVLQPRFWERAEKTVQRIFIRVDFTRNGFLETTKYWRFTRTGLGKNPSIWSESADSMNALEYMSSVGQF